MTSANITLDVNWTSFLAQHDLLWNWTWGSGGVSTIRPRAADLEHCGPGGAPGACCLSSAALTSAARAPPYFQIALASAAMRGCSPTAVPPRQCCLPVPWPASDHEEVSGCHDARDTRWSFNQFYKARGRPGGGSGSGPFLFQLQSEARGQLCLSAAGATLSGAPCDDTFSAASGQLWELVELGAPGGSRQLRSALPPPPPNATSLSAAATPAALCVEVMQAEEAGSFGLAPCVTVADVGTAAADASQRQLFSPLCPAGGAPVAAWACVDRYAPTPAPSPPIPTPPTPVPPPAPGALALAPCAAGDASQQWRSLANGSLVSSASGLCLTHEPAQSSVLMRPCLDGEELQVWSVDDGFFTQGLAPVPPLLQQQRVGRGSQTCLQADVNSSFCNATICPLSFARNFTAGTPVVAAACHNGDRSMLFALQAVAAEAAEGSSAVGDASGGGGGGGGGRGGGGGGAENLVPLTWATSAYVGNGAVGLRVASEQGDGGVLRLFLDNVMLGAGSHRQPTGYFRLHVNAGGGAGSSSAPLRVSLRQRLGDARLVGEVREAKTAAVLLRLDAFVQADYDTAIAGSGALGGQGAAVLQLRWQDGVLPTPPALEWVQSSQAKPHFAWSNVTTSTGGGASSSRTLTAFASVVTSNASDAAAAVAAAQHAGRDAELARHAAWWAAYWEQAFVTLPSTRVEALYYVEMYRFAASDRVTLHGLMGAFGPDGIFNLWPDYVWDMNEQVMYWLAAASNRPQISEPMVQYVEAHGGAPQGGLWMVHNYLKQARFDGRDDRAQNAWGFIVGTVKGQAGGSRGAPGKLKLLGDGLYHIVGCSSPEYRCYDPFGKLACSPEQDCNYELAQLRWGLQAALALTRQFGLGANLTAAGVDAAWWRALLGDAPGLPDAAGGAELVWYPYDNVTGFRLDHACSFDCPHRHFSHLLQMYDLETVRFDTSLPPAAVGSSGNGGGGGGTSSSFVNALIHRSLDRWYAVTCDPANWFNEECRGFTHCGFAAMSAVSGRGAAAAGNLTQLLDTLITPNGMYVRSLATYYFLVFYLLTTNRFHSLLYCNTPGTARWYTRATRVSSRLWRRARTAPPACCTRC
jgi:hypothetical protein